MTVRGAKNRLDSFVFSRVFFQNPPDVRRGRAVVRRAELPVFVNLREHGFDAFSQKSFFDVVNRHEHGDQRLAGETIDFRAHFFARGTRELIRSEPLAVLFRFPPAASPQVDLRAERRPASFFEQAAGGFELLADFHATGSILTEFTAYFTSPRFFVLLEIYGKYLPHLRKRGK
jgi:hypothetical protein